MNTKLTSFSYRTNGIAAPAIIFRNTPIGEQRVAEVYTTSRDDNDAGEANAALVADAFTVRQDMGLLPKQLVNQRAELRAELELILKGVADELGGVTLGTGDLDRIQGVLARTEIDRKTTMTLTELSQACRQVIEAAEADGVVVEDGQVVDLCADNIKAELVDIRHALCAAGYARRFPKACSFGVFTSESDAADEAEAATQERAARRICHCTNGFHEPKHDCGDCGGTGFRKQEG